MGRDKEHFGAEEWVDFARGLSTGVKRAALEAHLSSGCAQCRRLSDSLARLAQAAAADARSEAPQGLLEWARAIQPRRRAESLRRGAFILARRIYDSAQDPLPAGVRGGSPPRQALFEAGDFALDLNVDRERGSSRMVLVGQIADRNEPDRPVAGVPVLLVRGRYVTARALSNELGEFQLEYDPQEGLRLRIPVAGDKRIELPLPWFPQPRTAGTKEP